MHGETLKIKN